MASDNSKNHGSWLQKLGLSAGLVIGGAGAVPEQAIAGPVESNFRIDPDEDAAFQARAVIERYYFEALLKKRGAHIVVDVTPNGFMEYLHKKPDALKHLRVPQKLVFNGVMQLLDGFQQTKDIPEKAEIRKDLAQILNWDSLEPPTDDQLARVGRYMEEFLNKLSAKLVPPLPEQPKMRPKAKPPHFVMCSPEEPEHMRFFQCSPLSFKSRVETYHKWHAVKDAHEAAGAKVLVINGSKTDATLRQIYTANPVFYMPEQKTAYVPLKNHDPRQLKEQAALIQGFVKRGVKVVMVDANFNAGNMFYYKPLDTVFMGSMSSGKEMTPEDIAAFKEASGLKVTMVPMSRKPEPDWSKKLKRKDLNTPYYDLDCFFAPLPDGHILYHPEGTTPEGDKMLREKLGDKLIAIGHEDAINLAANLNAVQNASEQYTLIMPACSDQLEQTLSGLGYRIITPEKLGLPAGSFQILDGSVHCMALPVGEDFPAKESPVPIPIDLWHGGKRKRPENHIEWTILDEHGNETKHSIMLGDLLDLAAQRNSAPSR